MAKLIRDRSTPEQDAWWSAVQDAAKTAPKLTYERSAQMASEDVLERLEVFSRKHVDYRNEESAWQEISAIVYAIAAEVRELRKDKARLDFLLERCWIGSPFDVDMLGEKPISDLEDREEIDAAMGGEE